MTTLNTLQPLDQNRNALLLAEIAALLHDVGKLHPDFLTYNPHQQLWAKYHHLVLRRLSRGVTTVANLSQQQANCAITEIRQALSSGETREAELQRRARNACQNVSRDQAEVLLGEALVPDDFLSTGLVSLMEGERLSLAAVSICVGDIIEEHATPFYSRSTGQHSQRSKITELIQHADFCDSAADKGRAESIQTNQVFIATAFGIESPLSRPSDTQAELCNEILRNWSSREKLLALLKTRYLGALGDTRRSANDVTLWDHSYSVATLFKSALAYAVLAGWTNSPRDVRWRLLRVNFDVLALFAKATRIPDLLGYQRAVDQACAEVKRLIEEEYPLGNEVYRDTTGIYFTFPDLDLPAELDAEIRRRVEQVEPELAVRVAVTVGDGATAQDQLKTILGKARRAAQAELKDSFTSATLSKTLRDAWQNKEISAELCPICRLRPNAEDEDACQECLDRRAKRAQDWASNLDHTIWIDEVADETGRVALIAGAFGLDDWLSGDLVQTLLVKLGSTPNDSVPKNPSPARLRRVWETTQRFWQDVQRMLGDSAQPLIPCAPKRLCIEPAHTLPSDIKPFHTYDLIVKGRRLSVLWGNAQFITCDNLAYFEKVAEVELQQELQSGRFYELWTPAGYGERTRKVAEVEIKSTQFEQTAYTPVVPILADPQIFLALVPAMHALKVVEAIKRKYEREMGKVRNRLPITLGVVYFGRRTPLAAAIETARRMLKRPTEHEVWEVRDKTDCGWVNGAPAEVALTLAQGDRSIALCVPTLMGDNKTFDAWYPYWRVEGKPTNRQRWFVGPDGEHWVHVAELRSGDQVGFFPSTFDYEFLDTTARRFEVIYQGGKRRPEDKRQRPYYLEEFDLLEGVWDQLSTRLTTTQIRQLEQTIETKRQAWGEPRGTLAVSPAFRQFVCDALREAGVYSTSLEEAALRGWLADAIELHMTLQKEKA